MSRSQKWALAGARRMDLINVGLLQAWSSTAFGAEQKRTKVMARYEEAVWAGIRKGNRMPLQKLTGLGGWLTAECGFDAARRLVRAIEAQAAVAGRDR